VILLPLLCNGSATVAVPVVARGKALPQVMFLVLEAQPLLPGGISA